MLPLDGKILEGSSDITKMGDSAVDIGFTTTGSVNGSSTSSCCTSWSSSTFNCSSILISDCDFKDSVMAGSDGISSILSSDSDKYESKSESDSVLVSESSSEFESSSLSSDNGNSS